MLKVLVLLSVFFNLLFGSFAGAETIKLRSGKEWQGKIIAKTDKNIKVDFYGTTVTYYFDEIESIDGKNPQEALSILPTTSSGSVMDKTDRDKLIAEVMEVTGLARQVVQVPDMIEGMTMAQVAQAPLMIQQQFQSAVRHAYQPKVMSTQCIAYLAARFDEQRFRNILAAWSTPLAKKFTEMEIAATSLEALQQMSVYAQELATQPLTTDRIALLKKFIEVTKTEKFSLDLSAETAYQVVKAFTKAGISDMSGYGPGELSEDTFKANYRIQMKSRLEQQTLLSMAFTYRSASDQELREYIAQYETDDGQWLSQLIVEALMEVMKQSASACAEELARALPSYRKNEANLTSP